MSDTKHESDDLFDTELDEDTSEGSTTGMSDDELLDEETVENPKKDAATVRQEEIARWKRKLDSGEISPDQIPQAQKWVLKHITQPKADVNVDELIEKKLVAMKDQEKFDSLKSQLSQVAFKGEQKTILNAKYKELLSHGVPKAAALETALQIAQVNLNSSSSKANAMKIPTAGYATDNNDTEFEPYKFDENGNYHGAQGTPEQRLAALEKSRSTGGSLKAHQRYGSGKR